MNHHDREERYGLPVFPKRDLTLVRGEGALVWDDEGRRYIDCIAGIGVASVGHSNPVVADALAAQARTLVTCPGIFYNDKRAQLMEKLAEIAPEGLDRAFLCNSGAEAVEAAIKLARLSTGRKPHRRSDARLPRADHGSFERHPQEGLSRTLRAPGT